MGKVNYTPSQSAAIENRGGALLVAAAAGSGKTKVLVERLLSRVMDRDNPVDIDRFLIITYTRSAAAELRSKILDEINERISENPENRHLRRQVSLIYKAQISTIHSFCSSILRENAQLLDISPDFRVLESEESDIIAQKVLEETINERYEDVDQDFAALIDTMAAGRDDSKLSPLVMELYTKLKSHPYPEKWAKERIEELEMSALSADAGETSWGRVILDGSAQSVDYWLEAFNKALAVINTEDAVSAAYSDSFLQTENALRCLKEALGEGFDRARLMLPVPFPKLKPLRGGSNPAAEEAKRVRDACKKAMEKLAETFDSPSAEQLEDIGAVLPAVRALFSLTLAFDEAYSKEKARRKTLDFGDMEHLALKLLIGENGQASDKAKELSARFIEIMVDEYQDANEIQDALINAVSKDGRNIFMVGDVKQSIYRFRLADPTIFLRKYEAYKDASEAKDGEPRRIILQDNFRSRESVLDAVNFVFQNIMSKEFGEMAYTENERLNLGNKGFPENPCTAFELNLIEAPKSEDEDEPDKTEIEAGFVAERIRTLIESGMSVTEKDGSRRLTYGDIAILLRGVKGKAEVYGEALRARNIPFYTENSGGFWDKAEICATISLLSVIDNPRQDVALVSALRSPLFGFTPDELASIRTAKKGCDLYTALKVNSESNEKSRAFLEFLGGMRLNSSDMPADEFLWHVYTSTSALAVFGAMYGGVERKENLMALLDMARQFESSGYRGLFDFVAYLNKLMKRGGETARNGKSAGNAVTITSIHKSKGLEYPVVIIADTGRQFNKEDTRKPLLIHSELGVGPKRLDLERRIEYTTLPRMAIAKKMTEEMLAEELRVLYVAMTRAKEKLIVTCASKNAERLLEKLRAGLTAPVAPQVLSGCASMGEWLILTAMLRGESKAFGGSEAASPESFDSLWDVRYIKAESASAPEEATAPEEIINVEVPEAEIREIERNLSFRYAHEVAITLPSKLTATGLKGRFLDKEAAEEAEKLEAEPKQFVFDRPRFASERTELTSAERGIALHLVMQYINYDKCVDLSSVEEEIRRLSRMKIITAKQAAAVRPETILSFFESETGKSIKEADSILREFKFSVLIPASDYFPDGGEEKLLLQGVVDCCIESGGELTVIDFKTDYVTKQNQEERAAGYKMQLSAYAKAMERIMGKRVARKVLYFFRTGDAVEV